jgi:hypothetical protein
MFCLLWSTILNSEDDVEEGGIKIKKTFFSHENGNFFRAEVGKR